MTFLLLLMSCQKDDPASSEEGLADSGDSAMTEADGPPEIAFSCPEGLEVVQGENLWELDGVEREFYADLPSGEEPAALLFAWHGVGDTISNWRNYFAPDPDGREGQPLIVITPHDTTLWPWTEPSGLFWDLFTSESGDDNRESLLFESILGCLSESQSLDTERIYTLGFSAGAIVSNMLYSRYPDLIAAMVSYSGVWFNHEDQVAEVNTMGVSIDFSWEGLEEGGAPMLLTHGGSQDRYSIGGFEIVDFELSHELGLPWLLDHSKTVVDCGHSYGHYPHPSVTEEVALDFLFLHRHGQESPLLVDGLPEELASSCELY